MSRHQRATIASGSLLSNAECGEDRGGEQELQPCWERTRAVPAVVVEEFPSARTQEGKHVLEVGRRVRRSAKRRRIQWASPRGEEKEARETAADLEATRVEVLMGQAIAREVEDRPEQKRCESRSSRRAGGCPCGHMERDDHSCLHEQMRAQSSASMPRVWQ
jgi:hypothetical protein